MRFPLLAGTALLALAAFVAAPVPARAAYIVTFAQAGPNVIASGSGTIDVNGLTFLASEMLPPFVDARLPAEVTGASGTFDAYSGTFSGPSNFGSGSTLLATTGTGGIAGISPSNDVLDVPHGYVSGAPLADTATYASESLAGLGLTPGSYVYSFGSGANADTFTVNIGAAIPIPEPASLALLGTGLLGLGLIRRRAR